MDWLVNVKSSMDGASLFAAMLTGILGTAVLLVLRSRRPLFFDKEGWLKFLRSFSSTSNRETEVKNAAPSGGHVAAQPETVTKKAAPENTALSGPACPPELSLKIDRLEAKIRARTARRSG